MTRAALIGPRGIGAVHARVLAELGVELVGVAASGEASAREAAEALTARDGSGPRAFASVTELLSGASPDAVVIASPTACHEEHLREALGRGLPVLCEKPLIWPAAEDPARRAAGIDEFLEWFGARPVRLLLNTVSAHHLESVRHLLEAPEGPLVFEFHTRGSARGEDIAVDLLPHGWSVLRQLDPEPAPVTALRVRAEATCWQAELLQGARPVRFDLRQHPEGDKRLAFSVGGQRFLRRQSGVGASYRVFLTHDGGELEVEDPFVTRARRFLALLDTGDAEGWAQAASEAAENLAAVRDLLLRAPREALR